MMSTIVAGNAAEAAVLHALADAGLNVLLPFGGGLPFDLAVALPDGDMLRVQVKAGRVRNGCVRFNSTSTDHGHGRRDYRGRADLIAVSVPALGRIFMVPVDECANYRGWLRLEPTRNNQRRGVRLAADYSFEAWAASVQTLTTVRAA